MLMLLLLLYVFCEVLVTDKGLVVLGYVVADDVVIVDFDVSFFNDIATLMFSYLLLCCCYAADDDAIAAPLSLWIESYLAFVTSCLFTTKLIFKFTNNWP